MKPFLHALSILLMLAGGAVLFALLLVLAFAFFAGLPLYAAKMVFGFLGAGASLVGGVILWLCIEPALDDGDDRDIENFPGRWP
jgi:hypothetical protein